MDKNWDSVLNIFCAILTIFQKGHFLTFFIFKREHSFAHASTFHFLKVCEAIRSKTIYPSLLPLFWIESDRIGSDRIR